MNCSFVVVKYPIEALREIIVPVLPENAVT